MVIYMRDTMRDTHIETELGRGAAVVVGVPQKPAERTFPTLTFPSKFFPLSLTFSHTRSCPFPSSLYPFAPPLLIICNSGGGEEEMLKCQSDSENFLEKKLSLPSTPQQASLPLPPLQA